MRRKFMPQNAPQARADDGYIYPADGSRTVRVIRRRAVHAAPMTRRSISSNSSRPISRQQQQQYYDNRGYAPQYAPQVYAPRPSYQPRGLFTYQD